MRQRMLARAMAIVLAGVSALASAPPAAAQAFPVPELPPSGTTAAPAPGTLADSLARHPQCRERTNGCEMCIRDASGGVGCSTPGIACQPQRWRCVTDAEGQAERPSPN